MYSGPRSLVPAFGASLDQDQSDPESNAGIRIFHI